MKRRYLFAFLLPLLLPSTVFSEKNVQEYLNEGNDYLTSGHFNDALTSFDAAIRKEPNNYLSYFKRATAYLSIGRQNAAIKDFSKILELKPDFDQILLERARIYIKEGEFELAIQDLKRYKKNSSSSETVNDLLSKAKLAQSSLEQAKEAQTSKKDDDCISHATQVTRIAPSFANAWLLRAECHLSKGEVDEAAGDLARVAQLNPSNLNTLLLLSKINFFILDEPQGALTIIKQCLHYDPEQKQCKALFREMKKINKEIDSIENSIENSKYTTASNHLMGTANRQGVIQMIDAQFNKLDLNNISERRLHQKCYHLACKISGEQKIESKVEKWCSLTLDLNPKDALALLYRGEVLLNKKEFEQAVRDLESVDGEQLNRDLSFKLRELLQKARQQLKLSKKIDYYKLLDVSPNADSKEIKKAYRKKAHEWHPDKYNGELDKDAVVKKMAEINQAYQVLSDPDMRQQYDNGFDPFDPEQGSSNGPSHNGGGGFQFQPGGGNPFFFQNGFPFGDGGFPGNGFHGGSQSFKMHF